jgi:hypothetical protein
LVGQRILFSHCPQEVALESERLVEFAGLADAKFGLGVLKKGPWKGGVLGKEKAEGITFSHLRFSTLPLTFLCLTFVVWESV